MSENANLKELLKDKRITKHEFIDMFSLSYWTRYKPAIIDRYIKNNVVCLCLRLVTVFLGGWVGFESACFFVKLGLLPSGMVLVSTLWFICWGLLLTWLHETNKKRHHAKTGVSG